MNPTFLLIGAPKCGTTSFYNYLSQHPDVCMSDPKEPGFFATREYEKGLEHYWSKYYGGWKGERAVGEASTQNLYVPYVHRRIAASLPHVKLLALLRHPVERALSNWWMYRSSVYGEPLSFREAVTSELELLQAGGFPSEGPEADRYWLEHVHTLHDSKLRWTMDRTYVQRGHYAEQIERYLRVFPREQIKIVLTEDLKRDTEKTVRDTWQFLGIDPDHPLEDRSIAHLSYKSRHVARLMNFAQKSGLRRLLPEGAVDFLRRTLRPSLVNVGDKVRMDPETRALLVEHYRPHNRALEQILGRDLSHWDR